MTLIVRTDKPVSLGSYLRGRCGMSARLLTRLKRTPDGITRGGVTVRSIDSVSDGDVLELHLPDDTVPEANPALTVPPVYESEQVVVYDKPAGMPVHPSVHHHTDTLANCFAAQFAGLTFRPVNRLDSDTSGLCLVAKTAFAAHALSRGIAKSYAALVCGTLTGSGTVNQPIARAEASIITRCVRADGKPAVTHYVVTGQQNGCTALRLTLETGRTHQIRVHMAYLGHPLAGDSLYGGDCTVFSRHMLHCTTLSFREPLTGETVSLTSPPPWEAK